jgi:ATP-binding cassette subfamily F protein 3
VLALVDFSFEFAGRYLYKNAGWHIKPSEKIGLVGLNGTGKSTLLRVVAGEFDLREGSLSKSSSLKIGFLNQDLLSLEFHESVRDVVMAGRDDLVKIDTEINQLLHELETEYDDKRINRLTDLQDQFGQLGGYDWQAQGDKILEGLGFTTEMLKKPLKEFSGGWRMRAMLGRLLLQAPDLLLLDEPTNHLDLPTIEWLENYLSDYQGTYVIVSHDRFFLDKTVNRIAEVAHQQLYHYKGNFSDYLDQKDERDEMLQRRFENQQTYIKQQMQFISRFRYKASKSTAVQSRVKMLNKIEKIEIKDKERSDFDIKFNIRVNPGKQIVDIENTSKSYGDLHILHKSFGQIMRGDKIAIVGANGKGKSTLLRMIYGTESHEGKIDLGWNVESAFFAQHQLEALNLKNDLLNELGTVSAEYTEKELRTVLGCFLFTGQEVFKKVKVLSGGEKSRLALAKTLITQSNFLLLDEPTNHLDMFSTSVLAEALENYDGSIIFVSHDRTFISRVANKIWWIENGELKEYLGTFDEFNEWNSTRVIEVKPIVKSPSAPVQTSSLLEAVESPSKKTLSKNQIQKLEQDMQQFENEIKQLEKKNTELSIMMQDSSVSTDSVKLMEVTSQHKLNIDTISALQQKYDVVMETWLSTQE